jgi:hypothetical protein
MSTNKLDEIKAIVANMQHHGVVAIQHQLKHGDWTKLGEGHFSSVWLHPEYPEYAVKLCHRERDSWPFFAKYCMDNEDNEDVNFILPKIHSFHKIQKRGLYVALLDKLEPISDTNGFFSDDLKLSGVDAKLLRSISRPFGSSLGYGLCNEQILDNRYMTAAEYIYDDLMVFCSMDLHAGNIMMDKDKNLIVTDPVSFSTAERSIDKIDELDCLVKGVEYKPKQRMTESNARAPQSRKRARERLKWLNMVNVSTKPINLNVMDFAELERGMAKDVMFGHMFFRATVIVRHKEVKPKNDVQTGVKFLENRGILKRNQFLAARLGHHVGGVA